MIANIKKIPLAFGSTALELDIPEINISSIILPSEPEKKEEANLLVKRALENPIKSSRLAEIVNPFDQKSRIFLFFRFRRQDNTENISLRDVQLKCCASKSEWYFFYVCSHVYADIFILIL